MNGLKKVPAIEKVCPMCHKVFHTDNRHNRVTCSEECQSLYVSSPEIVKKTSDAIQRALIKKYGVNSPSKIVGHGSRVKNTKVTRHGNANYVNVEKAQRTKLAKYGDASYNNGERTKKTCLKKYGATCVFHSPHCPKAVGIRVSKFQRSVYDTILKKNVDAILEEYLADAQKSVDIYIPSQRKIVECHGDYWHCNPKKYPPDYYNKMVGKTAQEIWDADKERITHLRSLGYTVDVVWESDWKQKSAYIYSV
jgi:hypothetical protein